ncbi:MAG: septum formation initiator family protein [bacterium]|nr:septum formation initiator family protein [bacterium]
MKKTAQLAILLVLISTLFALGKSIHGQLSRFNEIYRAESEESRLSRENSNLKTKLEKEKNSLFLETQARNKLGFMKPGDVLYVTSDQQKAEEEEQKKNKKNWQEWTDLLIR